MRIIGAKRKEMSNRLYLYRLVIGEACPAAEIFDSYHYTAPALGMGYCRRKATARRDGVEGRLA